uniref:Putative secreted protein n=1 Tax=Anopheles marajoara TaxID=58244 RepID=A0A2M4C7U9_9DIPT
MLPPSRSPPFFGLLFVARVADGCTDRTTTTTPRDRCCAGSCYCDRTGSRTIGSVRGRCDRPKVVTLRCCYQRCGPDSATVAWMGSARVRVLPCCRCCCFPRNPAADRRT